MGGCGMGRTKLVRVDGGLVHDGAGYGVLAGTLSSERRFGKFSVQLSEHRVRSVHSTHRSDPTTRKHE